MICIIMIENQKIRLADQYCLKGGNHDFNPEKMICEKCGKVVLFEKIITPDGRIFHIFCFDKEDHK